MKHQEGKGGWMGLLSYISDQPPPGHTRLAMRIPGTFLVADTRGRSHYDVTIFSSVLFCLLSRAVTFLYLADWNPCSPSRGSN